MEQKTITIDQLNVHLRISEGSDPSQPPVVCIHGNLGSGRWFEPLMELYPGPMAAADLPNFGQSSHSDRHSIADYGHWAAAIIARLGWDRPVVLGHSLGGAVAMEVAATRPELIGPLVLVNSSPVEGLVTPKEHYPLIEMYKGNKEVLAQALKGVVPRLENQQFFAQLVDDAWAMAPHCFIGHAEALALADYRNRLGGYDSGVAVIYGTEDLLITPAINKATAEFFGASEYPLENAGHSPMVEDPEAFVRALLDFVKK